MDYKIKENIISRFNSAVYELYQATVAKRKEDNRAFLNYTRNAGEAISQTLEWALKYYLERHLSEKEKRYLKKYSKLTDLIEYFWEKDASKGIYFNDTVDDRIIPSVNFDFLIKNKSHVTNLAKHHGDEPDYSKQILYLEEVRKFINEYIDNEVRLKTIDNYERSGTRTWDLLYAACDGFMGEERNLVLITGPNINAEGYQYRNLALPRWNLIVDFDYNSEKNGFFYHAFMESSSTPHKIKISDPVDTNSFSPYSQSHYHYFANNFAGSGIDEIRDYNDWNRKFARRAEVFVKSFFEVFSRQRTIVLILFKSRRHVNFFCEKIQQFCGDSVKFVFANDHDDSLEQVADDFGGMKIDISYAQIADGLAEYSSNFGFQNPNTGKFLIPYMELSESQTSGELTSSEFAQLEEYFEVLHKGLPTVIEGESEKRAFLCGETKVSWYGIRHRFDVERQNFDKKYIKPIERIIENSRGKINLIHEAGFGGTTVARRIAWHFHEDYPTLILKTYRDDKVRELLIKLHQKTRKTILLILEVPQAITLDQLDALYKTIPQARPIVFIVVKRGKNLTSNDIAVTDWGNDTIDLINAYQPYLSEYNNENVRINKEKALAKIPDSNDPYKKVPFYVGLLTFEEKFYAIKDYIKKFSIEVMEKEELKKVLLYLSICDDYLGQGLPSSFFKRLFKVQQSDMIFLEKYFSADSNIIGSLLVSNQQGNYKIWKIRHNFFSKELKYQLLSGNSQNPELWKGTLADICVNFIWDSISDGVISEYVQDILQKLFIGNRRDRAGTDFTVIINDMDSLDGKEAVFLALKEAYPDNPHYCSHLARFYAYHNKNREKALNFANEAIRLSELEGNLDPLLYHIKGMCLRSSIYDIMDKQMAAVHQGQDPQNSVYQDIIETLVPQCARQFEISRDITRKQNKIDEYGYIAHIQLLIRAIDYASAISGKTKPEFFAQNIDPFSEWLDTCESLLEEVKRINGDDDESGKIKECENDILEFYENYEQILQNLRNHLDKGMNPSRTRRQIVRIYIKKKENYFREGKIINNILNMMEKNIENEPDNEKNYYLWFQAARHSRMSLNEAIGKLSKWKVNSAAIDSIYYFYIVKVFRALQGYSEAAADAINLIKECRQKGKSNIIIYEWYGKGNDLNRLVSRSEILTHDKSERLELVDGYFTEYLHDGNGKITIADRLEVFFSPTQAKLTSSDLNKPVQFYLGFSYDGLRADSYSVVVKGEKPRNTEFPQDLDKNTTELNKNISSKNNNSEIRNQSNQIIGSYTAESFSVHKVKRQRGKVIDLQKPPVYKWGLIETELGKTYRFFKENESHAIFNQIKIGSEVYFEIRKDEKGVFAINLEIIN